jgi:hypothetical protein
LVCAFTSLCEEDASWIDQYLAEIERLYIPFVINFDRCSQRTKERIGNHRLCIGTCNQDNPAMEFSEKSKQPVLNVIARIAQEWGPTWALAWDIDETWERDAPEKFAKLFNQQAAVEGTDVLRTRWVNLWGDPMHIRVDPPFRGVLREKLYRMAPRLAWKFVSSVTNGPRGYDLNDGSYSRQVSNTDIVCLHHGLMTHELRALHRDRWNRIYGRAIGKNPYQIWDCAFDPERCPPEIADNPYI